VVQADPGFAQLDAHLRPRTAQYIDFLATVARLELEELVRAESEVATTGAGNRSRLLFDGFEPATLDAALGDGCVNLIVHMRCSKNTMIARMGARGREDPGREAVRADKFCRNEARTLSSLKAYTQAHADTTVFMDVDVEPAIEAYLHSSTLGRVLCDLLGPAPAHAGLPTASDIARRVCASDAFKRLHKDML
jgi:hypothetical protein